MSKSILCIAEKAEDLLKEQFLYKLLNIDTWQPHSADSALCEKLIKRLDEIIDCVISSYMPITPQKNAALQVGY